MASGSFTVKRTQSPCCPVFWPSAFSVSASGLWMSATQAARVSDSARIFPFSPARKASTSRAYDCWMSHGSRPTLPA